MRKLLLASASALVFTTGAAMAQAVPVPGTNASTVDQIGDGNKAGVSQSGGNNLSTIGQGTPGTTADPADNNDASVVQIGGANDNKSTITQSSDGNGPFVPLTTEDGPSGADVTQGGTAALGTSNDSEITQKGSAGNYALIDQSDNGGAGSNNESRVTQDGSVNSADVTQKGDGRTNGSSVTQTGDENSAIVDQGGSSTTAALNASIIEQTGWSNGADVTQGGSAANDSRIYQDDGNNAYINQGGTGNNISFVDQGGRDSSDNANTATVNQGLDGSGFTNDSSITQTGNGNNATVNQNSFP